MNRRKIGRAISGVMLLGLILCGPSVEGALLQVGDLAPDFSLNEFGTINWVNLYDFEGHVVLLDFFGAY